MKRIYLLIIILAIICIYVIGCEKEKSSSRIELLTNHPWISDSLLADGIEAGNPGELLYNFSGETNFNKDGTGNIGKYIGTWTLNEKETILTIDSDSLPAVATAIIKELTENSLKIATIFPSKTEPIHLYDIRMTFVPK